MDERDPEVSRGHVIATSRGEMFTPLVLSPFSLLNRAFSVYRGLGDERVTRSGGDKKVPWRGGANSFVSEDPECGVPRTLTKTTFTGVTSGPSLERVETGKGERPGATE